MGALASDGVKDRPAAGRAAAARRAVLDSVRRQSKLASKVLSRGLADAGGLGRGWGVVPYPLSERKGGKEGHTLFSARSAPPTTVIPALVAGTLLEPRSITVSGTSARYFVAC